MNRLFLVILLGLMTLAGCATTRPTITYDAVSTDSINAFFIDGLSIASSQTNDCYFSLSILEVTKVGGSGYLKVWFLYQNRDSTSYLLKPWEILKLHIVDLDKGSVYTSVPDTPNKMLRKIDKQEASQTFLSLFGGALQSFQVSSSNLSNRDKWMAEKQIMNNTIQDIMSTQLWYSLVRSSVSSSLLQKNTILPEQSVNGFVYFPLKIGDKIFTDKLFDSKRWKCKIEVLTPRGSKEIEFLPVDAE